MLDRRALAGMAAGGEPDHTRARDTGMIEQLDHLRHQPLDRQGRRFARHRGGAVAAQIETERRPAARARGSSHPGGDRHPSPRAAAAPAFAVSATDR
jgi:hypothetical protein